MSCGQEDYKQFKSGNSEFYFLYSNSWELSFKNKFPVVFLKESKGEASNFKTNLNVLVQDLTNTPIDIEQYHSITLQQIKAALGNNAVQGEKNIEISGVVGKELVYIMPKDVGQGRFYDLKVKQIYFIKNNKAYLVTYTAKNEDFKTYLKSSNIVFESFEIIN